MKKIISIFLSLMLFFACIPFNNTYAADQQSPRLTIEAPESVKTGDTFTVKIGIENNPGIISLRFNVEYDMDKLALVGYTDTKLIKKLVKPAPKVSSPYIFYWTNGSAEENSYANGTVIELRFEAKSVASASEIKVNLLNALDFDLNKCSFEGTSAKVDITSGTGRLSIECPEEILAGSLLDVYVNMDINPGITVLRFRVLYDASKLKLESCSDMGLLSSYVPSPVVDGSAEHYFTWLDGLAEENNNKTGNIAKLTFRVLETEKTAESNITVEFIEAYNAFIENKSFNTVPFSIKVLSHIHNIEKTEAKAATHFEAGNIEYYTCTVCKLIFEDKELTKEIKESDTVISKIEHNYEPKHNDKNHWEECSCGDKINEHEHSFGKWEIITSPDIATPGQKEHTCGDCGYTGNEEIPPCMLGDMDGDGKINSKDDIFLQRYLSFWSNTNINVDAADVNSDGVVNAKDAIMIQRCLAKWHGYESFGK